MDAKTWLTIGWVAYGVSLIFMVVVLSTSGTPELVAFVIQTVLSAGAIAAWVTALVKQRCVHKAEKPWYVDYDKERSKERYL